MKSKILITLMAFFVLVGCYAPRTYVKDFNGNYRLTTEATLYAIGEQGGEFSGRGVPPGCEVATHTELARNVIVGPVC